MHILVAEVHLKMDITSSSETQIQMFRSFRIFKVAYEKPVEPGHAQVQANVTRATARFPLLAQLTIWKINVVFIFELAFFPVVAVHH